MAYTDEIRELVWKRNPGEAEFHQAVDEFLNGIEPVVQKHEKEYRDGMLLERLVEPERSISFRIPWVDDHGKLHVNRGYRIQFNSAIGPYKGGLRFHPSVNRSILNFLAFEQIFKNALTGLSIGGGKGGADFDPKGKSDREVMAFCQSFMTELFHYIGAREDVPAGDIGVGAREIGFLYGQYKRLTRQFEGTLTGKGIEWGGSLVRVEATGFGLAYITEELLQYYGDTLQGKTVAVSGSGNVAVHAAQKAEELGARVVTMSDSGGYIYDERGIDIQAVKEIKEVRRGRIREYVDAIPSADYYDGGNVWETPCDVALPCATQNELSLDSARLLVKNGVKAVCEGANMPTTLEATEYLLSEKIPFLPGKASNAGGVAVSELEMAQNAMQTYRSFEDVDSQLQSIMKNIFRQLREAAEAYDMKDNFVAGANIAGFSKVARVMKAQGYV